MTANIERITIRLGDRTLDLTLDEARDLKATLDSLLGSSPALSPTWPLTTPSLPWHPYEITCGGTMEVPCAS